MYFILSGNLILRLSQEIREVAYDRQKKCLRREEKSKHLQENTASKEKYCQRIKRKK
jgi:hypothetical protein